MTTYSPEFLMWVFCNFSFCFFAFLFYVSWLVVDELNLWCKKSGLLSDNIFSGVPTLSINQVTFAQTSHKKNPKRERSRASKLNPFINNQTSESKRKRKKQDHLRMNNSTGSNNHLRSIDLLSCPSSTTPTLVSERLTIINSERSKRQCASGQITSNSLTQASWR